MNWFKSNEQGLANDRKALSQIIQEVNDLSRAVVAGKLDVRGNAAAYDGEYREIIEGINTLIDAFEGPVRATAKYADMLSNGVIPPKITDTYNGDFNDMKNSLNDCVETMDGLLSETDRVVQAIREGKLETRGNANAFAGRWGTMIEGVNGLIDAFTGPINVAADYMGRIAKGDIPPKICDTYSGDYNEIKNSLNDCIDVLNAFKEETDILIRGILGGKLEIRGNADTFSGGWSLLIKGVNHLIDAFWVPIKGFSHDIAMIGQGEIPSEITAAYQGDFNEIKNCVNDCIKSLNGLVEGKDVLSRMSNNDYTKSVEGVYPGIYNEIAQSINLVSTRIHHTIDIVNNIAFGDFKDLESLKAVGRRSENDRLMPSMIMMIESIKALVEETEILSAAAVEGKLDTRGDASKHQGEFRRVVTGINETLDAVIAPIKEASSVLQEMAKGNLDVSVNGDYMGDHAEIKNALNETILTMSRVLSDINQAADQVTIGSRQVSDGSQALSQGSTEQASSIEELTASITDIALQTKQNASDAGRASELAIDAKEKAIMGNDHMKEMLGSMDDISESSRNISKIIKVIDDIAFQTNILALNAAVEAARAGQHGKGFAVVAEEVRSLAARCAQAARNTTDLIEGSINKVQHGTKIANDTASALEEIVTGIEKSADLVVNIASASNEQATGISMINKGIEQVSQVVQNNSATAEESAAASEELSGQAELLKQMVNKFILNRALALTCEEQTDLLESSSIIMFNGVESDKY